MFNLDKFGYASDLTSIEALPEAAATAEAVRRRLAELGISEADVEEAVSWARQP